MSLRVYFKWLLIFLPLVFISIYIIIRFELIIYGIHQGKGQFSILWNARPITEVIKDPEFPDSLKTRLLIIENAKEYAKEIGLSVNDSYTTFYNQQGKTILWNLSACEPYSFTPYTWTFPFTGEVSYKGFFNLEEAVEEKNELKDLGYDTRIRSVSAWSTLGWFKDPVLSSMLSRDVGSMTETIFHELTHQTIFYKDSIEFNENLASFIGKKATIEFLNATYGDQSVQLTDYLNIESDAKKYREHILRGKDLLNKLYQSFGQNLKTSKKKAMKDSLIAQIFQSLDSVDFITDSYSRFSNLKTLPNNAYFMSFSRYHEQSDLMDSLYSLNDRDLHKFIVYCKKSKD